MARTSGGHNKTHSQSTSPQEQPGTLRPRLSSAAGWASAASGQAGSRLLRPTRPQHQGQQFWAVRGVETQLCPVAEQDPGLRKATSPIEIGLWAVASKCTQTSGLILLVTVTVVSLCAVFSRRLWMSAASNQQADAVPKSGVLDRDNENDSCEGREPEVLTCEGHRGAPKTNHDIRASRGA